MRNTLFSLLAIALLACDGGLALPPDVEPGFGGIIRFAPGTWPPRDSLNNLWLFASQIYPIDSNKVFAGILGSPPTIFLYPSIEQNLPYYEDSIAYSFNVPPSTYPYVGVIQRFADDLNIRSFRVVGVYATSANPPAPISIVVRDFQFVTDISFTVNFHNPPPQPF